MTKRTALRHPWWLAAQPVVKWLTRNGASTLHAIHCGSVIGSGTPEQLVDASRDELDQKDIGSSLERQLRYAGHEAVFVTGGVEALAMLPIRNLSLVVLDVDMPERDGLTVLRLIKELTELKDVPVVMYSADTHHKTTTEAKRLGAVDFLV